MHIVILPLVVQDLVAFAPGQPMDSLEKGQTSRRVLGSARCLARRRQCSGDGTADLKTGWYSQCTKSRPPR